MKQIEQTLRLETHDPAATLALHCLYLVQHHLTFRVSVVSGDFRGRAAFCVSTSELADLASSLNEMHNALTGTAKLEDYDSDGFLQFETEQNGHVSVSGIIGGDQQSVRFRFGTDQTCLMPFSLAIEHLLKQC